MIEPGRLEEDLNEFPDKPPVISAPVLNAIAKRQETSTQALPDAVSDVAD